MAKGGSRRAANRRLLPVAIVLVTGMLVTLAAVREFRRSERQTSQEEFRRFAQQQAHAVEQGCGQMVQTINGMRSFYSASEYVTRDEFTAITQPQLADLQGVRVLAWVPRVPLTERSKYELRAREDGMERFQIVDSPIGKPRQAARRPEFFPVYYVEPYLGNERLLGWDLEIYPAFRQVLRQVCDRNETGVILGPAWETSQLDAADLWLVSPIYASQGLTCSVDARRESLIGFVIAAFDPRKVFGRWMDARVAVDVALHVVDVAGPKEQVIYSHPSRPSAAEKSSASTEYPNASDLRVVSQLDFANRSWRIECEPTPAFYASHRSLLSSGVLTGGLLLTVMLAGWLHLLLERTERVEIVVSQRTAELRESQERLLQMRKLESVGQLAAGIAHEINTPIQYIGDNTRFLDDAFRDLSDLVIACRELRQAVHEGHSSDRAIAKTIAAVDHADVDYLLEEAPRAITQSLEGVQQVAKIVRSMKEFSHPGSEERQLTDINRTIENTLTIARNEWKYVAEVVTDLAPKLPMVPCLLGEINQVLLNLIVNAAHAITDKLGSKPAEKGQITIRTRLDGDWVEIRVEDTGTGIPEEVRPRIYDPFFTTKPVGRGTGQGLAVAHGVVTQKHGGTIRFETNLGKGTIFFIRLPLHVASGSSGSCSPLAVAVATADTGNL